MDPALVTPDAANSASNPQDFAFEYATDRERLYDFCLWEYRPPVPAAGKLRPVNLLRHSFLSQGVGGRGDEVIESLRAGLGDSRTVWGIKQDASGISWEFYFYDYARLQRECSVPRVLDILRPLVPCAVKTSEQQPYFMFSIDLAHAQLNEGRPLEEVQLYIGNVGTRVSSGICYSVMEQETTLKNFYFFFDAKADQQDIVSKLTSSAYLPAGTCPLEEVLWPALVDCQTIVVSNKRDRDGVYFCRVSVRQLLHFLRRTGWAASQIEFIERHESELDHMRYDVGFDYRFEEGGLRIVKSAWYGTF